MRDYYRKVIKPNPAKYARLSARSFAKRLIRQYGITLEEWHRMLIDQRGCCGVCLQPCKRLHVDHCHETGRVRGLLCPGCNTLVGVLENRKGLLEAAKSWCFF